MAGSPSYQVVDSNSLWTLDPKDLPNLSRLGQGLSGFLYETSWRGEKYARKDFPLGIVNRDTFVNEAQSLFKLDDKNIVKCFRYTVGRSSCSLLQEYADDNLQNVIQRMIEEYKEKSSTSNLSSEVLTVEEIDQVLSFLSSKVKERENTAVIEDISERPESKIPFKTPEVALDIISQIATGMKYLHDQEVVHGDLKPKNVLVCFEADDLEMEVDRIIVKVADFGLVETKRRIKMVSKRTRHFEILTWKAPELFSLLLTEDSDDPFTDSEDEDLKNIDSDREKCDIFLKSRLAMADVYSFGLTCSYVLGGKLIYPHLSLTKLREQRLGVFRPELPPPCSQDLKVLIYSCLKSDPILRPTFSDICTKLEGLQSEQPQLQGAIPGLLHSWVPALENWPHSWAVAKFQGLKIVNRKFQARNSRKFTANNVVVAGGGQAHRLPPSPSEVNKKTEDSDKRPWSAPKEVNEVVPNNVVVVANFVAVVYNAEKKFSTAALDIAINSHAKAEGDTILVLAYLEKFFCDFGILMIADVEGESILSGAKLTAIAKAVAQAKIEIATLCQRSGHSAFCRKKNIKLLIKVVPGANPKEKVAKEITDQQATCVIFDKKIITSKEDKEYYTKKLSLPIFQIGYDGRSVETISSFGQAIPAEESTPAVPRRCSSEVSLETSPSLWSKLKSFGGSKRITENHRRDSSGGNSLRTNSSYGSSRTGVQEESDFEEDHNLQ